MQVNEALGVYHRMVALALEPTEAEYRLVLEAARESGEEVWPQIR